MRAWRLVLGSAALLGSVVFIPVGGGTASSVRSARVPTLDLSTFSERPLERSVDLLFLHHSIGGQMLADPGVEDGRGGSHPNGGGLRRLLLQSNYRVHEATYGSDLGEHTDLFDWLPKFRDRLGDILVTDSQDQKLASGRVNRVVLFKSCFPNNYFEGEGTSPGSARGPALTLENAKATLRALLPIFARHPDTLFVYLTTPPNIGVVDSDPVYRFLLKRVLGKPSAVDKLTEQGRLARSFADWTASTAGWLKTPMKNVAVFNYYDVLTDEGASNFLAYPSGADARDNHPSAAGNQKAAALLVPFLNRAVRRAEIAPTVTALAN